MNTLFNEFQYNHDTDYQASELLGFGFSGFDMMALCKGKRGVAVQKFNGFDTRNISLNSYESQFTDGGGIISRLYSQKTLSVTLVIQGESYDDLISLIDEMKGAVSDIEGNLDVKIGETHRRYKATLAGVTIPSFSKNDDYVEGVVLDFLTSPHWFDPKPYSQNIQNTQENITKVIINKGNYKVYPVIKIITHSGHNSSEVKIKQRGVGETIPYTLTIPHTLIDNELLVIDYVEKVVTINGQEVDFDGIMMPMERGQTNFEVEFTGTKNYSAYFIHNPTFL